MNTRIHRSAILFLGAVTLFFSQAVWSLGLGDARVESFLNQPLDARIQLITQESDDLDAISAGLASADDYELIGASRDDISMPLQFSIKGSQGSTYISVSSNLPINDPVVRLIVEVNWTNGRMLREYTLFLDPPTVSQKAPAPRIEPARPAPASQQVTQETEQPAATKPATQATPADRDSAPTAPADYGMAAGEYGPVKSGDTLWEIARDWSDGRGQNLNKVMLAIQRKNPRAFSRNNINLLQRGAILRMPEADEIDVISTSAANNEVTEQSDAFTSRRNIASSSTPLLAEESMAPEPPASEELPEATPESEFQESDFLEKEMAESETPASEIQDSEAMALEAEPEVEPQLELVPPSQDSALDSAAGFEESDDTAEASVTAESLREELARKEEELITQQQQNVYLEQRLSELEGQLAESKEGTLDDENLSSMEERLREERLAAAEKEASVPKVTPSQPEDKPWYSGMIGWLIGLLVLVAAVAGWLMSRRGRADEGIAGAVGSEETLRGIADEAEDVLRVLDSDDVEPEDPAEHTEEGDEAPVAKDELSLKLDKSKFTPVEEDAEVLDEDSADPEIQLDLARAYISMGDKEAARVILDEVIANGSDEQQAEASKMKEFL
jgi:pilus assembly protein FimV